MRSGSQIKHDGLYFNKKAQMFMTEVYFRAVRLLTSAVDSFFESRLWNLKGLWTLHEANAATVTTISDQEEISAPFLRSQLTIYFFFSLKIKDCSI